MYIMEWGGAEVKCCKTFPFMNTYITCMTIAGSDPSGGAGIQADIKTFAALGCYAQAAVTALTVQNTLGVQRTVPVEAELVRQQVQAVTDDVMPDAVKIGMVPNVDIAEALAACLQRARPAFVVFDPVMVSSSGHALMATPHMQGIACSLFSQCTLVTPNLPEAQALLGSTETDAAVLAQDLGKVYPGTAFLIKGGHAGGCEATDVLCEGGRLHRFSHQRLHTANTHGTGCTLSSAIAAHVARGLPLPEAVAAAKAYLTQAMQAGAGVFAGHGAGSLNHFFTPLPSIVRKK